MFGPGISDKPQLLLSQEKGDTESEYESRNSEEKEKPAKESDETKWRSAIKGRPTMKIKKTTTQRQNA